MSIYQIILSLIAVFFLYRGFARFMTGLQGQTIFKLVMTAIIWGTILFFSILPKTAISLSHSLGLGENLNTLIFIGFVFVFMIIFKLLNLIERLEHNISDIVRTEALEKLQK